MANNEQTRGNSEEVGHVGNASRGLPPDGSHPTLPLQNEGSAQAPKEKQKREERKPQAPYPASPPALKPTSPPEPKPTPQRPRPPHFKEARFRLVEEDGITERARHLAMANNEHSYGGGRRLTIEQTRGNSEEVGHVGNASRGLPPVSIDDGSHPTAYPARVPLPGPFPERPPPPSPLSEKGMSSISISLSKEKRCQCGVPMARLTAWIRENPGRKFRSYKFYDPVTETRGCKAFEWVDQSDGTPWQTEVINNLLLDKKLMKGEINDMKREVDDVSGQRRCLLNEIDSLKMKCKALSLDRKKMSKEVHGSNATTKKKLFVVFCCFGLVLAMYFRS